MRNPFGRQRLYPKENKKMKTLTLILAASLSLAALPALAQQNNANANAPGQDRTCLVTTGVADSWADADIVDAKWLPRKAAESQAKQDPTHMKVFDYANDPLVTGGTYASAEELCNEHFAK